MTENPQRAIVEFLHCPTLEAYSVRAYITFQQRDGWSFHLLSADLRTALTPWKRATDLDTLLGVIERLHGDMEEVAHDIRRWNRGGVWIDLSPAQCRYFGIRTS